MIYKHEIIDDKLYLYFDYSYEFSKEFNKKGESFIEQIKNYIKNKKIKFNGDKVVIVVSGIMAITLILGNDKISLQKSNNNLESNEPIIEEVMDDASEDVEELEQSVEEFIKEEENKDEENKKNDANIETTNDVVSSSVSGSNQSSISNVEIVEEPIVQQGITVTVHRTNGSIINLNLEEYLIGVVGAEMPASFNIEALKAQALVARTYALKRINNNQILTDSVSTQVYKDNSELRSMWGSEFDKYYNKVKSAVESTTGMYITYGGNYIDAVYHSTSNGKTEDALYVWGNSVPYLKSVDSSWDVSTTPYSRTEAKDFDTILNILGIDLNSNDVEILQRNESGRVVSVRVGSNTYSGVEFRNLLGLRSADFDLDISNGTLNITTRGYGHGVGMSQYGANEMGKMGYNYEQIIKHYYQGVSINRL